LHINHGWRADASNRDAAFVAGLGKKWRVPVLLHKLKPPGGAASKGLSWEEQARDARTRIFEEEAGRHGAIVLTAHQADDLAETVLWRLLTGAAHTHAGGIAVRHGVQLRPFLKTRKADLQTYLREERQRWREDSTNHAGRFLRSRMRKELMPQLEALFPRAVEHLVGLAFQAQNQGSGPKDSGFEALSALLGASGIRMRRAHGAEIQRRLKERSETGPIDLPGGWRLFRELHPGQTAQGAGRLKRWILEACGD
jgi:tRNA(Ile)-lysidine synthetase-like protein